ncbi:unnamed protein product, partial [Callosobruchus maculatus]
MSDESTDSEESFIKKPKGKVKNKILSSPELTSDEDVVETSIDNGNTSSTPPSSSSKKDSRSSTDFRFRPSNIKEEIDDSFDSDEELNQPPKRISEPKQKNVNSFVTPTKVRDLFQSSPETSDDSPSPILEDIYPISPIPKQSNRPEINGRDSDIIAISDDDDDEERPAVTEITDAEDKHPEVTDDEDESPAAISISSVRQSQSLILDDEKQDPETAYKEQCLKVQKLQSEIQVVNNTLRTVKLNMLHDGGQSIRDRRTSLELKLLEETTKLSKMEVSKQPGDEVPSLEQLEMKTNLVLPKTFGERAMATFNAQKALTVESLNHLHGSLKTCPTENDLAEDPKGLKVDLMLHQKRALEWLIWREGQKPSGGILADDMGLGKTLTMISLVMKSLENKNDEDSKEEEEGSQSGSKWNGGTLVVCPASLINQWSGEIDRRTKRGKISYEVHHGSKRDTKAKRLAKHDIVITTYAIVKNESERGGALFDVKWRRIVLDEAHQIRNFRCQTSEAACRLAAKSRWALTGTPVHNKELDMYALLKFLRCVPFDDLQVWKRWVGMKDRGGEERLHTVVSSIMLRRTKAELIEKNMMTALPERTWELIEVQLSKREMAVYQRILVFSRTLFAQFLHQHAEKNHDYSLKHDLKSAEGPNAEYFKMRQKLLGLSRGQEIQHSIILVLLLRLRQICCHPSLIKSMLGGGIDDGARPSDVDGIEGAEELDLLEHLNKLNLDESKHDNPDAELDLSEPDFRQVASGLLNPSNPVFSPNTISSKIQSLLDVLKNKISLKDDKVIIISQWTSYLEIVENFLKKSGYKFDRLNGSVPVQERMKIVNNFNDPSHKVRV